MSQLRIRGVRDAFLLLSLKMRSKVVNPLFSLSFFKGSLSLWAQ